jgi:hypothetical protein
VKKTREEDEGVRVGAAQAERPDPPPLHRVQPEHEEGDRRLSRESERELHGRESALGQLDQIGNEIEPREDDCRQPDDQGQSLRGLASRLAFRDHLRVPSPFHRAGSRDIPLWSGLKHWVSM